jgi:hypothetical protein
MRAQLPHTLTLIATILLVPGCKDAEHDGPKRPKNIYDLSNKIVGVSTEPEGEVTEIILQQSNIWNEEMVVFALASEANRIAKEIQSHFKEIKTSKIRFTIQIPLVDKFGNSSLNRVISINYRMADIYRINYARGFEPQQFLNLYESAWYIDPIGHKLVFAFCNSEPGKYAAVFCRKERLGQGEKKL